MQGLADARVLRESGAHASRSVGVAAEITLARYTHTLPEDVEQAREKLSVYVAERQATKATGQ